MSKQGMTHYIVISNAKYAKKEHKLGAKILYVNPLAGEPYEGILENDIPGMTVIYLNETTANGLLNTLLSQAKK